MKVCQIVILKTYFINKTKYRIYMKITVISSAIFELFPGTEKQNIKIVKIRPMKGNF